jgi:hypothetical protein
MPEHAERSLTKEVPVSEMCSDILIECYLLEAMVILDIIVF